MLQQSSGIVSTALSLNLFMYYGLYNFKTYNVGIKGDFIWGCDEKDYGKWVWNFVEKFGYTFWKYF